MYCLYVLFNTKLTMYCSILFFCTYRLIKLCNYRSVNLQVTEQWPVSVATLVLILKANYNIYTCRRRSREYPIIHIDYFINTEVATTRITWNVQVLIVDYF